MNLRDVSLPHSVSRLSGWSAPNFHIPSVDDVVGNLGNDLDHNPRANPDEDAEFSDHMHNEQGTSSDYLDELGNGRYIREACIFSSHLTSLTLIYPLISVSSLPECRK